MAVTAYWYENALLKAFNKEINWNSDSVNVMLLTSSYTPDQGNSVYLTYPAWAASTAYTVGQIVVPTTRTGHAYKCTTAGTSAATQPTWPTASGGTVTDGGVTWTEAGLIDVSYYETTGTGYSAGGQALTGVSASLNTGTKVISWTASNVTWSNSTITAQYAVIYDNTPASNKPLLGYVNFGANQSSSSGNFTITWAAGGILQITVS